MDVKESNLWNSTKPSQMIEVVCKPRLPAQFTSVTSKRRVIALADQKNREKDQWLISFSAGMQQAKTEGGLTLRWSVKPVSYHPRHLILKTRTMISGGWRAGSAGKGVWPRSFPMWVGFLELTPKSCPLISTYAWHMHPPHISNSKLSE